MQYKPDYLEVLAAKYMRGVYACDKFRDAVDAHYNQPDKVTELDVTKLFNSMLDIFNPSDEERKAIEELLASYAISKTSLN